MKINKGLFEVLTAFCSNLPVVTLDAPASQIREGVLPECFELAQKLDVPVYLWDAAQGIERALLSEDQNYVLTETPDGEDAFLAEPNHDVCDAISDMIKFAQDGLPGLFIMLSPHRFWDGEYNDRQRMMALLDKMPTELKISEGDQYVLMVGDGISLPNGPHQTIMQYRYEPPALTEIEQLVEAVIKACDPSFTDNSELVLAIAEQARGLSIQQIKDQMRLSFKRQNFEIGPVTADHIREFKVGQLRRLNAEIMDLPTVEVGGMENLKLFLRRKRKLLFPSADGSPQPQAKGLVAGGIPGTGKSLLAKEACRILGVPGIRFDVGAMLNQYVGGSETNVRQVLAAAEAIAPCVLFIDELDKAGLDNGSGDSGVMDRILGTLLTWMQEKTAPVFVIATLNRADKVPAELLRKGRFDEIFRVDLPTLQERTDIFRIHLSKFNVQLSDSDLATAAGEADGFVGSEIESIVGEAWEIADEEKSPIKINHLISAIRQTTPLSKLNPDAIAAMRQALQHARLASIPDEEKTQNVKKTTTKRRTKGEFEIK